MEQRVTKRTKSTTTCQSSAVPAFEARGLFQLTGRSVECLMRLKSLIEVTVHTIKEEHNNSFRGRTALFMKEEINLPVQQQSSTMCNYIQQHLLARESFDSFISEGGIRDVFNLHVLWLKPVTLPFARE